MQHAVGAPLPPEHGPGQPGRSWAGQPAAASWPGPGPGPAAAHEHGAVPPGAPVPPPPPAPPAAGAAPDAPLAPPPVPPPVSPPPSPSHNGAAPAPAPGWSQPDAAPPVDGPGPVAAPVPPEQGTGATTLAVLLIGPAGAGKTTVARYWAARRRVPTAHVSLDDVREWVRSGFADPQSGWNEHSETQYRLARRTCGFAARNFLANGISCILDDAVFPDRPVVGLGGWKRHVGPGLLPVVLLPGLDVVLERNAARSGNRRLSDEEVASIHGRMAGWYGSGLPIIDNSKYDVPTTARVLDEALARAIASPPSF
ncbi:AAA family ATPase [Streptomyces sp. NPDC048057]|uniref:AAA family ATPase n=1 Tax=Streptomyces sp. NPDC048057 TaxID=3155628 RepID=UPI00340B16F3